MKTVILVATHKPYRMPVDPVYMPLHVGAATGTQTEFAGDDRGDNISGKNRTFCELTGLYWAWKNLDADAIGLCHYRRHFGGRKAIAKFDRLAGGADFERILNEVPCLLPRKRHYFIETTYNQYIHAHHVEDLTATRAILSRKYPEYLPAYDRVMRSTSGHRFNMLVMKKPLFDDYCAWLFDILFELEKVLDISSYSDYDRRVFGFVGERLLDVYISRQQIAYRELPVVNLESQHWVRKIWNFLRRKFTARNRLRASNR